MLKKRFFLILLFTFAALIGSFVLLVNGVHKWVVVHEGSFQEINIGDCKDSVLLRLILNRNEYKYRYVALYSEEQDTNINLGALSDDNAYRKNLLNMSSWHIRFESWVPVDNMLLKFENNQLREIFRHRDLFEVP